MTTSVSHNAYMQFRLFDVNNNQTIQDVTYVITVTRGTASSVAREPLLLDFFHTKNGLLTLHVEPNPDLLTIYGEQDTKNVATTAGTGAGSAPKSENTTGPMNFALTPFTGVTQISTSSDIPTNTGSIHAALSWSPNPLAPNTQSTLNISFYDPTGTTPLTNTNLKYNLNVYDKIDHPVITKQNLLATNAAGTETIVFPAAQIYQVQITGLVKPGQTPDFTRNGVATGYVVVPEFPGVSALMVGLTLLIRSRKSILR
jgi:hypothetical protein